MLLVLHNVTMASLRTFARKVAADDETWRNNNQTWARANFSFFIYFLFQIKWHFEFFVTEKWGVDIHPIHPPPLYPPLIYIAHTDHIWFTTPNIVNCTILSHMWKFLILLIPLSSWIRREAIDCVSTTSWGLICPLLPQKRWYIQGDSVGDTDTVIYQLCYQAI